MADCTSIGVAKFLRAKPFIFGVGVEKCGSSSLHNYVAAADNVSVPSPKELEFFSTKLSRGLDWYLSHFDLAKEVFFDFTPSYHWDPSYLDNIARASRNNTVVVMLRDPVARAYSAFVHRLYWFFEQAFVEGKFAGYDATFLDVVKTRNPYIMPSYTEVIARVTTALGGDKTVVIPMESFIENAKHFVGLLEEKLDCELEVSEDAVFPRNNSLAVPSFVRGHEILEQHPLATDLIREPADVYFCRGGFPRRIAEAAEYDRLKNLEAKWLMRFDVSELGGAFERYYDTEVPEIERLTGLSLSCWGKTQELGPKVVAPLSLEAAEANIEVGTWSARKTFVGGQRHEAIEMVQQFLKKEPAVPEYRRLLGWMYLESGEGEKAEEQATIALTQAPANADFMTFHCYVRNRLKMARLLANHPAQGSISSATSVGERPAELLGSLTDVPYGG
jgi:hypothetical protein